MRNHALFWLISSLWRHRGWFLAGLDLAAVYLAVLIAYLLRFEARCVVDGFRHSLDIGLWPYLRGAAVFGLPWVFLLWRDGAYLGGLRNRGVLLLEFELLARTGLWALAAVMAFSYVFRGEAFLFSRLIFAGAFGLAVAAMSLTRYLMRAVDRYATRTGILVERLLVLGGAEAAGKIRRQMFQTHCAVNVIGYASFEPQAPAPADAKPAPPHLGPAVDIRELERRHPFEIVLVAAEVFGQPRNESFRRVLMRVINHCEKRDIPVYLAHDSFGIAIKQQEVGCFADSPLIVLQDASLHPLFAVFKRALDLGLSGLLLLGGLPLWLLIMLGVRLTSRGPVFFAQVRIGAHKKPFVMYKFRTMEEDADRRLRELVDFAALPEPVFNLREDPRVTRFGRLLRRFSLDEFPQLWNVIRGEMSLVGPRPERLELVRRYNPWQQRRLKCKPGITGYQQVVSRGDPSLARRIELDLFYLKHQSLLLDLAILCKTVFVVLRGDGLNPDRQDLEEQPDPRTLYDPPEESQQEILSAQAPGEAPVACAGYIRNSRE